jgi:hypothetical protein
MTAALAALNVTAEHCRAAYLDGRHHLQLRDAYVTSVFISAFIDPGLQP